MADSVRKVAQRQSDETILDHRIFLLDAKAHARFLAMLDKPLKPSRELRALMQREPIWERASS